MPSKALISIIFDDKMALELVFRVVSDTDIPQLLHKFREAFCTSNPVFNLKANQTFKSSSQT
jgi:hypothetical protein